MLMAKQLRHGGLQRRLAAELLKCGVSRIWMEPTAASKISRAITRSDVRRLIAEGLIKTKEGKWMRASAHRRQDIGSRKGRRGARAGKKERWLKIARPQRKLLLDIKKSLKMLEYRKLYRLVKGGSFRSKAHLKSYIQEKGLTKEKKVKQ